MSAIRTKSPFIWYELMASDHNAAFEFYSQVLGWTKAQNPFAGPEYTIVNAGPHNVGGLMTLPAEACAAGAKPCWMAYLGVDDIDATIARVTKTGGKLVREPADIPGIGRWAIVTDPHGAHMIVMKPFSTEAPPPVPTDALGIVGWRELHAGDGTQATQWYTDMFGWDVVQEMDMGPMGKYRLFSTGSGQAEGGIMTKMADTPTPYWTFYFNVDGVEAAMARVNAAGGKVLMGPHQVPGGMWIAYIADPQGAMFGVLSAKR